MKNWTEPTLVELNLDATAYAPENGHVVDGSYVSTDGNYHIPTYGPSGTSKEEPR